MRQCATCAAVLDQLAADEADQFAYFVAREALCGHLVDAHRSEVPGAVEGCVNCMEWTVVLASPRGPAAAAVDALVMLADQHRASHLLPAPGAAATWYHHPLG